MNRTCRARLVPLVSLLLLGAAGPARADSGMAFLEIGGLHLLLVGIFVVWLEAWVLRGLLGTDRPTAVAFSFLANGASYLAGLPALWAVSNEGPLYPLVNQWRNPAISVGVVLGVFGLTLAVEAPILKAGLRRAWQPVLKACLGANLVSYLVLLPIMGPFSYFPDYGIRPLFQQAAEALDEPASERP